MAHWLLKTEPDTYSIDDLKTDKTTNWHGVRNYQARNFLQDMKTGDQVLIYHSVAQPVGVAGLAEVSKLAYPDVSQFDKKSEYFDQKSDKANPRWFCPEIRFVKKFKKIIPLSDLKKYKQLSSMSLMQKGSRLSVQPVKPEEFKLIIKLAESD